MAAANASDMTSFLIMFVSCVEALGGGVRRLARM
jgi:hypothetical protein